MNLKINFITCPVLIVAWALFSCTPKSNPIDNAWLVPFVKVDTVNPVLTPGNSSFYCPIRQSNVKWENKDVFNPAAIVRGNKVYLIYRAEDTVGRFNGTSRLGLAVSEDGFHFVKEEAPIFYPDNDSLKIYEWE